MLMRVWDGLRGLRRRAPADWRVELLLVTSRRENHSKQICLSDGNQTESNQNIQSSIWCQQELPVEFESLAQSMLRRIVSALLAKADLKFLPVTTRRPGLSGDHPLAFLKAIKITKKRLTKTDLRVNLKLSKFDSNKHTIYPDIFIFINFGC